MKKMLKQDPRKTLAELMRRFYYTDLNTSRGGNLSIRTEDGQWITPGGLDKSDMQPTDMMFFKNSGEVVGNNKNSSETYIHRQIIANCPEFNAIIHNHDLSLIGFSVVHEAPDTDLYPTSILGERVPVTPFALPGSDNLAKNIIKGFKDSKAHCVVLENHGVFIAHENMFRALDSFESLDLLSRTQQAAAQLGPLNHVPGNCSEIRAEYTAEKMESYNFNGFTEEEKEVAAEIIRLAARAYKKRIFAVNMGVFAVKTNEKDFIMIGDDADRANLAEEDIVAVRDGKLPEGTAQPVYALFCRDIFRHYPNVKSVAIAQPATAMAFASTGTAFETRILPESYTMLRSVNRLPFGAFKLECSADAEKFNPESGPITIVENEAIVSLETDLFTAYESIELVDEYAKIQINAASIGKLCRLTDEQISAILQAEENK